MLTQKQARLIVAPLILTIAGVVGMTDSFYLLLEYLQVLMHPGQPTPCTVNSLVSCTLTVQGPWGHYFPEIPNPMFGMLWYSGTVAYGATRLLGANFSKQARAFVGCMLLLGIAFSYRLYFASVLQLGGVCPFCLTSTTASTLILLAFCVDDAGYADRWMNSTGRKALYAFQICSVATFVVGLPLFIGMGLRWIPEPMAVITHWSFPLMVALVLIMAGSHWWTFKKMRNTRP